MWFGILGAVEVRRADGSLVAVGLLQSAPAANRQQPDAVGRLVAALAGRRMLKPGRNLASGPG